MDVTRAEGQSGYQDSGYDFTAGGDMGNTEYGEMTVGGQFETTDYGKPGDSQTRAGNGQEFTFEGGEMTNTSSNYKVEGEVSQAGQGQQLLEDSTTGGGVDIQSQKETSTRGEQQDGENTDTNTETNTETETETETEEINEPVTDDYFGGIVEDDDDLEDQLEVKSEYSEVGKSENSSFDEDDENEEGVEEQSQNIQFLKQRLSLKRRDSQGSIDENRQYDYLDKKTNLLIQDIEKIERENTERENTARSVSTQPQTAKFQDNEYPESTRERGQERQRDLGLREEFELYRAQQTNYDDIVEGTPIKEDDFDILESTDLESEVSQFTMGGPEQAVNSPSQVVGEIETAAFKKVVSGEEEGMEEIEEFKVPPPKKKKERQRRIFRIKIDGEKEEDGMTEDEKREQEERMELKRQKRAAKEAIDRQKHKEAIKDFKNSSQTKERTIAAEHKFSRGVFKNIKGKVLKFDVSLDGEHIGVITDQGHYLLMLNQGKGKKGQKELTLTTSNIKHLIFRISAYPGKRLGGRKLYGVGLR